VVTSSAAAPEAFPGVAPGKALLLTDGSVLVQEDAIEGNGTNWYKLTPDIYGSYVNGTWTKVASIPNAFNYDPAFYASAVLPDYRGRRIQLRRRCRHPKGRYLRSGYQQLDFRGPARFRGYVWAKRNSK
jgi:hypothetical protein